MFEDDYYQFEENTAIIQDKYYNLHLNTLRNICNKMKIDFSLNDTKNKLAFLTIPQALTSDNFLRKFYNNLEEKEQEIFKYILYYEYNDLQNDVQKQFKYKITLSHTKKGVKYVWWLELFLYNDIFDDYLRTLFEPFIKNENQTKIIPIDATVGDIDNIKIDKFTIDGKSISQVLKIKENEEFILNSKILYELSKNKKIQLIQNGTLSKRTQKLLAESFEDMQIYHSLLSFFLNIEFLSNKKFILPYNNFTKAIVQDDGKFLKTVITKFIELDFTYEYRDCDFSTSNVKGKYIVKVRKEILAIIKKLDTNQWINIEYIIGQIKLDKTTLKNITNNGRYAYNINHSYNSIFHLETVVRYFVKSFINILHLTQICDLAITAKKSYTKKDYKIILGRYEEDVSRIEYFRLTNIGKFALGFSSQFKSSSDFNLILNQYALEVVVDNPNKVSELFLQNISEKIDDNRYKTDVKLFIQNVNSKKEYEDIKKSFLDKSSDIPLNWEELFETLDKRIDSLTTVASSAILIKIKNNKEILRLISSNEKLKTKILKADDLHMVVLKENLTLVKNTLKEYGILI
ncbi:MAG: hypothetical protein U9Q20_00270 [Campylobacterota bacterium]|nr:hypothetical protein [Campylobacterota bacterium]